MLIITAEEERTVSTPENTLASGGVERAGLDRVPPPVSCVIRFFTYYFYLLNEHVITIFVGRLNI